MPIGLGIGALSAGGAIVSGVLGSNAAKEASQRQAQSAQEALAFQKQVYDTNTNNLQPWMKTGTSALYSLAQMYGLPTPNNPGGGAAGVNSAFDQFTKLPSYTFPMEQGMLALTRKLNAEGRNMSGAELKESQQFGSGLASGNLNNYLAGLSGIAGMGQGAAGSLAGFGANMSGQIGNTTMGVGQAEASGIVGSANALGGGVSNAANSLSMYSMMARSPMFNGNNNNSNSLSNPSSYQQLSTGLSGGSIQNMFRPVG